MNRSAILDGWRGVAIVSVLIGHFFPLPFFNAGRLGVELFFVLSGRLMGEILFVKKVNLPNFYWRRISRIVPVLYLYIFLSYFLTKNIDLIRLTPNAAFAGLTFTYNYLHNDGYGAAIIDHVWSLCIEEHAYIVLGVAAYLAKKNDFSPKAICFLLAIACMINGFYLTYFCNLGYYDVFWRTDTRATGILLGCGFYCWRMKNPLSFDWITSNVVVLLLLMGGILSLYPVPDPIKYSLGTTAFAIALVFLDRLPPILLNILKNRILCFFGVTSFSIYIFQQPFYHFIPEYGVLPMLAIALTFGLGSYYFIETPVRRQLNKIVIG